MTKFAADLSHWWTAITWTDFVWFTFGLAAQSMFAMRFLVQLIASERVKRSIVPDAFWYFSFAGGFGLFLYAVHKVDPVFMLGQGLGLFIYARNIYFISLNKKEATAAQGLTAAQ